MCVYQTVAKDSIHHLMKWRWLIMEPSFRPLRWLFVVVLAVLAPMLAHSIHSLVVMLRGFRLYNSELWVLFVGDDFSDWRIGILLTALFEAGVTFVVLWTVIDSPFRRRLAWLCSFAVWISLAFIGEIAVK